jgi:hypothetical protein
VKEVQNWFCECVHRIVREEAAGQLGIEIITIVLATPCPPNKNPSSNPFVVR